MAAQGMSMAVEETTVLNTKPSHLDEVVTQVLSSSDSDIKDDKGQQHFLDNVYSHKVILCLERVFGSEVLSPGGIETTRGFFSKVDLKPGQKVLDACCGIGGAAFYLAKNFGVEVVGIDLSVNMISIAVERAAALESTVQFEVADCTKKTYPDNTFDVIFSRGAILHIQDKPALFSSFYKWLKPGGNILITDCCKRAGPPSPEFAAYINKYRYDLHDVQAYGQMLENAGFDSVIAEDRTNQFNEVLQKELDGVEKDKDGFIKDFGEEAYNNVVDGWKAKLMRTKLGEQTWGWFFAEKKVNN